MLSNLKILYIESTFESETKDTCEWIKETFLRPCWWIFIAWKEIEETERWELR